MQQNPLSACKDLLIYMAPIPFAGRSPAEVHLVSKKQTTLLLHLMSLQKSQAHLISTVFVSIPKILHLLNYRVQFRRVPLVAAGKIYPATALYLSARKAEPVLLRSKQPTRQHRKIMMQACRSA